MIYEGKAITLKDGRCCVLRAPRGDDAADMALYLKALAQETHFTSRLPEECNATEEQERRYLEEHIASANQLMIVAEVGGRLAGNCQIAFLQNLMMRHRATIGIGLYEEFWGLGIGTAMLNELVAAARARGIMQIELSFVEGNDRARALYEKIGFRIVGSAPNAVRLPDGTLLKLYHMVMAL